jgi:hypothetical protein
MPLEMMEKLAQQQMGEPSSSMMAAGRTVADADYT